MVKMSDVNKDIGMRIRELRELSDIFLIPNCTDFQC